MIIFGLNIILALSSNLYDTDFCRPTDLYDLLAEQAIESCTNRNSTGEELDIINHIISIEKEFNLPDSMKGMALAAACHESRFNPNALGDRKFSKNNKPKAVGLYQMWPWWENEKFGYGIDRRDVEQSTRAFLTHISKRMPKVTKTCRFKSEERLWIAAWVHAIRKPRPQGRCFQKPLHLRVLRRWHRNIKKLCKDGSC